MQRWGETAINEVSSVGSFPQEGGGRGFANPLACPVAYRRVERG